MPVATTIRSAPGWAGGATRAARVAPLAAPLAAGTCLLAGAAYVAAVDPSTGGGLTACPIRAATGRWCPGCGLTRATHHLLHGDVAQALSYNVLAPVVLAAFALGWWAWMRVAAGRGAPAWVGRIGVRPASVAAIVVVAFVVARNVPAWAWLRGG